jgi:hypothetical protein
VRDFILSAYSFNAQNGSTVEKAFIRVWLITSIGVSFSFFLFFFISADSPFDFVQHTRVDEKQVEGDDFHVTIIESVKLTQMCALVSIALPSSQHLCHRRIVPVPNL